MSRAIHVFRPQRTSPEDLEAIFVGREHLLEDILKRLGRWQPGGTRQHYLLIGPRGIGKTNLLMLIEHRIRTSPELSAKWCPIILPEDLYGITKVSDLFVNALKIFSYETEDVNIRKVHEQIQFDDNEKRVIDLSLDAFRQFHISKKCGILLMLENVNRLLEKEDRYKSEIHLLRKILIEEDWLVMIGTSPTLFNAVTEPEEPLFGFFHVQSLSELNPDEQQQMLKKLAAFEKNTNFDDYLKKFRSRLQALYHFTGGNPRLTIMLYDLVANQNITDVKTDLDLLLDKLTPFYQDRMKDIPVEQGKLLEAMALLPEWCTPTELAKKSRIPAKTVRALISRMEGAGYIRKEQRRQKRTVYIIPERFFRIWHQMNHSRAARGRVQYLLEFFSNWYATKEERDRVWNELTTKFQSGMQEGDENRTEDISEYMMYVAAVSKGVEKFERAFDRIINITSLSNEYSLEQELNKLDEDYQTNGKYFIHKGYFLANYMGWHEAAYDAFRRAIELKQDDIVPLFNQAIALDKMGREREAQRAYKKTAALLSRRREYRAADETQYMLLQILKKENDSRIIMIAAYLLGRTANLGVVGDIIEILQNSKYAYRRQHCATALGLLKAEEAIQVLVECLQDKANNVRGSAATALGRIGTEQAVAPLIECLQDEANSVRGSAASALGQIDSKQAVFPLIELLNDEDIICRSSAATALGRIGTEQAVAPLIECLQDEANSVRGSAATALGRIGSEQAVTPLIECLRDEANNVRHSAVKALGQMGSERALAPLIKCLQDEANNVRRSAATALGQIGSEQAVGPLIECLQDEANDVRGSAATALGQIGSEQAMVPLIKCLQDKANDVRGSAATALGRISSEQAVAPLIECLQDEANNVRGSAATALGQIGSEQAVGPLIECLRDEDKVVRKSVKTALSRIASEKPISNLTSVIGDVIEEFNEEPRERLESVLRMLLQSAFRSGNLEIVHDSINVVMSRWSNAEVFCAPYSVALEYLESNRNPAVIERQQLEMREAVQLLVDVFDKGCT